MTLINNKRTKPFWLASLVFFRLLDHHRLGAQTREAFFMSIPLIPLNLTEKEIARFHRRIKKGNPEECWPCIGITDSGGYGKFTVTRNGKQITLKASRVAFFLHWGLDPEGWKICHECDNPPCCNPHCLFAGTNKDNSQDMVRKGRAGKTELGKGCGSFKLTWEQVRHIRHARKSEQPQPSQKVSAARYNISPSQISYILSNRSWKQ